MDKLLTENINRLWSSLIIDELYQQGVRDFYVSPGLRNAPLLSALRPFEDQFRIHVVHDERSAAYQALGQGKNSGRAAVLVCTSGTALSNYYPAVIEAFKSRVPLIVLSSDRPPELNEADANQTISQKKIFGTYLRGELYLESPTTEVPARSLRTSIAHLYAKAHFSSFAGGGPIHINLPFREPLDATTQNEASYKNYLARAQEISGRPATTYAETYPQVSENASRSLFEKIKNTPNTLIVVGELTPWSDKSSFKKLSETLNLPVYFDVLSSLKYRFPILANSDKGHCGPIPTFDHPEVFQQFSQNAPQLIIHFGGRLVSKHYYKYLRQNPHIELITINDGQHKEDPSFQTTQRYLARPDIFAQALLERFQESSFKRGDFEFPHLNWSSFVRQKEEIIDSAPLCYPVVSKTLIEKIPNNSTLYLGNSTVIRSFDSYASEAISKNIKVLGHRGASGIEGFFSAASGAASCPSQDQQEPVTLVLGDISALHDLNGLYALKEANSPVIALIINNRGGGIFSLLPMEQDEEVKNMMFSPHNLSFEHFAKGFHLDYESVRDKDQLITTYEKALHRTLENRTSSVIEVEFDNQTNLDIYRKLKTIKL